MTNEKKILITGAAGNIGSIGPKVIEVLTKNGYKVRAMVRKVDERSEKLKKMGAEIVVGDLTVLEDVKRVVEGVNRIYFSMSPSSNYIEATALMAAVAKHNQENIDLFVNMSQMTVSSMDYNKPTDSQQQRNHWLSEQILQWSGLPVVEIRPTVFMEHPFFHQWAFQSCNSDSTIKLPFGDGKTSPIATQDIANVISTILMSNEPSKHIGKVYQLTGPKSESMNEIVKEYSKGFGKEIKYVDVPFDQWYKSCSGLVGEHLLNHFATMAKLHKDNRYDRHTDDVELLTGKKPLSISEWIQSFPTK